MFHKLLIANRGEIACRIIRTAKALNIKTVAVYSEVDADALHVKMADEAVYLGQATASDSYLNINKIIQAAKQTQADAIHPGYGFLSENSAFATAVQAANLIFVGPPAKAITAMGSKAQAKALMAKAGVPLIPGYHGAKQDQTTLTAQAQKIGFPLLIKASHGGGGKGMRVVSHLDEFPEKLAACQREAEKSFASSEVILEKYLEKPRHIEIQVFVDHHGNGVYLFERDCSIQRRHQKILEEAPAIDLSQACRQSMGEIAVHAAKSIDYRGAGTFEFLYSDEQFYFMEMNTRLQVEHPVTEAVTGEDLVAWQLHIAAGEKLPKTQQELTLTGHALEMRVYAEDPLNQFLPATGTIEAFYPPTHGRLDHGIQAGDQIGIHYDPMLAKLIVHGEDRAHCLSKAKKALNELHILGLTTNIAFLKAALDHTAYLDGQFDTHFIEDHETALHQSLNQYLPHALSIVSKAILDDFNDHIPAHSNDIHSPWHQTTGWRALGTPHLHLIWYYRDERYDLTFHAKDNDFESHINGDVHRFQCQKLSARQWEITAQGMHLHATCYPSAKGYYVSVEGYPYAFEFANFHHSHDTDTHGNELTAPMPGIIRKIFVNSGAKVQQATPLIILEAMKMEHTITAPKDGIVVSLNFKEGDTVEEGALLLALDAGEP